MAVNINPLSGVINDGAAGAQAAVGQVQLGQNFSAGATYGQFWVNPEGRIPCYSYGATIAVAAGTSLDFATLAGSATATIRITKISIAATTATTAQDLPISVIRRSTAG